MLDFFSHLFDSAGFAPRRDSPGWSPQLVWLHGTSDALIWLAYLAIPVVLIVLVRRRRDVPFPWTFWMFGAFILSCGLVHLLDTLATAVPLYRLSGLVKLITAVASWATVIALLRVVPKALTLKSPLELERQVAQRTAELTRANAALTEEILERRRVERLLRDSEERFRLVVEHSPSGVVMIGADGVIVMVNAQVESLFGYRRDELIGRPIEILVPARFREGHPAKRSRFFASPQPRTMGAGRDLAGLRKDGSEFPVEIGLAPLPIDGAAFVLASVVDVSERKQAEQAVRDSERRYRALVEATPQLVWMVGGSGGGAELVSWWRQTTGQTPAEAAGWGWLDALHPDDREPARAAWAHSLETKSLFATEYRLLTLAGTYRHFAVRGVPLFDEAGAFREWVGTLADVTEARQAEQALRLSEQQLRLVTDHAPIYLAHCDREGRYQFVNESFARRFGLSPDEVVGRRIPEVVGRAAYEAFKGRLEAALAGEAVEFEAEIPYDRVGPRFMHCAYQPELDEAGQVRGVVAVTADLTRRKRAEDALRHSEEQYRLLTEALPHLIWTMRPDMTIEFVNRGSLEFSGWPLERVNEQGWGPLVHPDDLPAMLATMAGPLARGEAYQSECRLLRHDGEYRRVVSQAIPLKDAGGAVVKWIGTTTDVHDVWQTHERLRESEERYRLLTEALPHMVWTMRPDLTMEYLNRQALDYTGWALGRINAEGWGALVHPDDLPGMMATIAGPLERGEPSQVEYRLRRHDGEYRRALSQAVPLKGSGGAVVKWIGTTIDVHDAWTAQEQLRELNANLERRVAERSEALREQEERFRSAFDFAAIGMALVSLDGKWLRVNRALCELVGYPEQELLDADFQSITHPDDLDADLNHVEQMLAGEIDSYQVEKRYVHKAGHVVHVLLSVSLVRDGKGEPLYFIAQIQDVTRRKQSEEQTQASLREKEVLLREIHHRVKNNLQVISSLLDLQARYVRDPDAVAMFRSSQDRVRSMALVHERLYRSASLSSIDFAAYLMNLVNHLFAAYGVDHARVRREWALQAVSLPIDAAVPCGLVVNELISNCLKYAFPGGRAGVLRLRLAQEDGEVLLSVIDDGVGLPIELGEDVQGATTFGFRLIGALVAQLHGAVRLARGREGHSGTTVEIRFPAGHKQSERRGDA